MHVSVDDKEMLRHLRHGAHVLNLDIEGSGSETCLVKDLQFGYLGDDVIHVDFARVDLDEEVTVNVHLHFVGESEAARKPGSILSHDLTELEVICKVNAIPEEIRVDLSEDGRAHPHRRRHPASARPDDAAGSDDRPWPTSATCTARPKRKRPRSRRDDRPEVITESKKEEAEG